MSNNNQQTFASAINTLLETIEDETRRSRVKKFWIDEVVPYFIELHGITESLENDTIDYESAGQKTIEATKKVLTLGAEVEKSLNDADLSTQLKNYFRTVGAPYGLASKAVRHAFEKPGGYPGDYELLEFIYNNVPTSEKFGYCADMVFLDDDYARAVRSRKDKMKTFILSFLQEKADSPRNILNIACGASRELREIFKENDIAPSSPVTFSLIDKSKEALTFSESALTDNGENISFKFFNNSVYDYLKEPEKFSKLLSGQDLIYSIGLADYIPAESLSEQIKFFYDLLRPGGKLVIAHKDSRNYLPLTPDWWADWTFYLRDEKQVVNLVKISGIENYTLTVEREKNTNIIFFLNIKKE